MTLQSGLKIPHELGEELSGRCQHLLGMSAAATEKIRKDLICIKRILGFKDGVFIYTLVCVRVIYEVTLCSSQVLNSTSLNPGSTFRTAGTSQNWFRGKKSDVGVLIIHHSPVAVCFFKPE